MNFKLVSFFYIYSFRRKLKTHLFTLCFNDWLTVFINLRNAFPVRKRVGRSKLHFLTYILNDLPPHHAAATLRLFQTDDAQKMTRRRRCVFIAATTTFTSSTSTKKLCQVYCKQCWDWPKRTGGSAAEMFEILPRDWNLKPIFTQKWSSVDMNWGFNPQPPNPRQFQPWLL